MQLKDEEYTIEELMDLIDGIDDDFMIHIKTEVDDGEDEGSI